MKPIYTPREVIRNVARAFIAAVVLFALLFLFVVVFLLSPKVANAATYEQMYMITCKNATETYFIRPSGILYAMNGLGRKADCMMVRDTEGQLRVLCAIKKSDDTCVVSEIKEI